MRPLRRLLLTATCAGVLATPPVVAAPEPVIQAAVARIGEAEVTTIVGDLVGFGTRYSGTAGNRAAADYLATRLQAIGRTPARDPFAWGATTLENVHGRQDGVVRPTDVVLVLAHYDSTSETPAVSAPGADDNASSVAVVLEAARVLAPLRFEASIRFLFTGGEEQGLLGSREDVQRAVAAGERLVAVINLDMVGYWPTGWARDVDACGDLNSAWLAQLYATIAADYEPTMPVEAMDDWGVCGDDQVSYVDQGFPAIIVMDCHEAHNGNMDGETTPHYHRTSDTPATVDFPRLAQVARATTAAVATIAVPITRTLYRNDDLVRRELAGAVLRAGQVPAIDPAAAGTTQAYNPPVSSVLAGDGLPAGEGNAGVVIFYETDRDDVLRVERRGADVIVSY